MAGLAAQMPAASHTYSRRVPCSPATPRLRWQGSPLRCMPHHTHLLSRRGALLACLALPATAERSLLRCTPHHTPTRVGWRCSLTSPCLRRQGSLLRCLHHTYSRRVHCSPATPRLRWQDSLLIELHHTYSRRDSARLLFPASDDRACCSDACFTVTYSRRVHC